MSKKELAIQQSIIGEEQIKTLKDTIAKDATDAELQLFVAYCNRTGLDPLAGQIHFVKRGSGGNAKASFQTSIDGFRSIADSSGEYEGQTEVEYGPMVTVKMYFRDKDYQKREMQKQVPEWAKVGVYRKGFREALYAKAYWDEYCPNFPNQTMWTKMPRVMLAKVAEALALRKAFPKQMAGVYTKEEMEQADDLPAVVTVVEKKVENVQEKLPTATKTVQKTNDDSKDEEHARLKKAVDKLEEQVNDAKTFEDMQVIDQKLVVAQEKVSNFPDLAKQVEEIGVVFAEKSNTLSATLENLGEPEKADTDNILDEISKL